MLTLAISHNIFLDDNQIQNILDKKTIECIGVSVPVWFHKGTTSEPAVEVFSKYSITNVELNYPISTTKQGYKINLPQISEDFEKVEIEKEEWEVMTQKERDLWEHLNKQPDTAESLKNIEEGGKESLKFKTFDTIKKDKSNINVIHYVEIQKNEVLEKTLS